jgi:hypothetical protein
MMPALICQQCRSSLDPVTAKDAPHLSCGDNQIGAPTLSI